ncbi:MAG TPA: VTT domain-containing protein, partial [Candidatus Competibacteraceae bacterium]|nr:VTT domain-containing protein [Candidatus Competibacteraceae bacterium]
MNVRKQLLLMMLILLIGAFFAFDLGRFFDLDYIKSQQAALEAYRTAQPVATAGMFFLLYVAVTALSLPGAAIMTLVAGALFGLVAGTVIVSFASTLGATLAFLVARFLLRDTVQTRFSDKLRMINAGMTREGGLYLFTLRLIPVFPFFIINLLMGLTPIRTWTFYWVSQLGMLAGTLVYVNAGRQLAQLDTLRGILSPGLLASLALLGVFPLIARSIIALLRIRRIHARWPKPRHFDRNLIVIGGGSAGLVSAYIAAAVKAKVTLEAYQ